MISFWHIVNQCLSKIPKTPFTSLAAPNSSQTQPIIASRLVTSPHLMEAVPGRMVEFYPALQKVASHLILVLHSDLKAKLMQLYCMNLEERAASPSRNLLMVERHLPLQQKSLRPRGIRFLMISHGLPLTRHKDHIVEIFMSSGPTIMEVFA